MTEAQKLRYFCANPNMSNFNKLNIYTRAELVKQSREKKFLLSEKLSEFADYNLSKSSKNPSKWMKDRIKIKSLFDLDGITPKLLSTIKQEACDLNFVYKHVGGLGTNSPNRGVCVMGNTIDEGSSKLTVEKTYWTSSQQTSSIVLQSKTVAMPPGLQRLSNLLIPYLQKTFPKAPISPATFALFVANEYVPGNKHTICEHTDDQPWYADPPVFASVTFFPDGPPEHESATFRFQIRDESKEGGPRKDVYLPDASICMMRADVNHRVLPPLKKFKNPKRRINLTFRNLVSRQSDSLGFVMAFANHYRYYGLPTKLIIPSNKKFPDDLLERYLKLNPYLKIENTKESSGERNQEKRILLDKLQRKFRDSKRLSIHRKMAGKTNVVLETVQEALKLFV